MLPTSIASLIHVCPSLLFKARQGGLKPPSPPWFLRPCNWLLYCLIFISLSAAAIPDAVIITIIVLMVVGILCCCFVSLPLCISAIYCLGFNCWLNKRQQKIARETNPVIVDSAVVPVVVVPDTCTSAAESADIQWPVKTPAVAEVQKVPSEEMEHIPTKQ